ncbi:MAG: hypothetical protein JXQ73_12280 [Phycisphaerae bacterium]|nr:hypothetical protein [Phycisphaerae bacterium]
MDDPTHEYPSLKGALHAHSTCGDGDLSPGDVLRVHRDLGFDFVALTDHDFLMRPGTYEREGVPDEFEGMLVFKGVERTVFARGYLHVNEIPGRREVLHVFNHPAEYDLTVEEVIDRIQEIRRSMPIHAVEVTLKGFYTPEYDTDAIPYPKIASDDSHTREGCGRAWVEVSCPRERDAILGAIKNGQAQIRHTWTATQSAWPNQGGPHRG